LQAFTIWASIEMQVPAQILEMHGVEEILKEKQIYKLYIKAKNNILAGYFTGTRFKKREPKKDDLWYFRINKQYRAIGKFRWDTFVVGHIDDHQ